jgi:hypothetical protein
MNNAFLSALRTDQIRPISAAVRFLLAVEGNKTKIYITVILTVVLYGCETWSLVSREEHRLRVFERGVLRGMFGPKGG